MVVSLLVLVFVSLSVVDSVVWNPYSKEIDAVAELLAMKGISPSKVT